ncbi:hypothetical protein ACFQ61_08560 [Streptomyces sp. NPDC056500]|uniref:hypothetical protein n=1 Tax=Streptomyces sp. NPDC056500 TaxID=3345840 RepID=UPI0036CD6482
MTDPLATLRAIADPAQRAKAASAAAEDAPRPFRELELEALRALVDAHGGTKKHGAVAAAAREMGVSGEALRKRLNPAISDTAEVYAPEGEPGLFFAATEDAVDDLHGWALLDQELNDRRDPTVRGALAAGVSPRQIQEITGLTGDLLTRLAATSAGTAVDVPLEVWESAVPYLADLALTLPMERPARDAARALAGVIGLGVDTHGYPLPLPPGLTGPEFDALSPEEKAERTMATKWPEVEQIPLPDPDSAQAGPDGWAASYCAELTRAATESSGDYAVSLRAVAGVLRHVRTTGTLPTTGDSRG